MGTPADRVPPHLLRHLHLKVNISLPRQPTPNIEFAASVLSRAPELTQHRNTVTWTFLSEPPADGESMLVWQPPQMGNEFASDGYIWADAETALAQDYKGQTLERYIHRSGLRPGLEQMSTHARCRYRLKQNPSLWLVSYHQADPRDHRPVQSIHLDNDTRRVIHERSTLEKNKSQLVRQEFMLHDTAKFPIVSLPGVGGPAPYAQQPMGYPGNVMAHMSRGQYNPYMQQQQQAMAAQAVQGGFGPSPSKRPRHGSTTHAPVSMTGIPGPLVGIPVAPRGPEIPEEVTEENDSSGADSMDILTPRDIALQRYVTHHEWLEEILSSPFDTHRIVPPVLGLGRKGELESLTKDFFDAPIWNDLLPGQKPGPGKVLSDPENVTREIAESNRPTVHEAAIPRVGKLGGDKAEDFTKRAISRVAMINAEMETLKKQHAKRMAKLSKGISYKEAEQRVRIATLELINGEVEETAPAQAKEIEDLKQILEQKEGKAITSVPVVECTEKGGQEEIQRKPVEEPQEPEDFDMTGTDTFNLDEAQLRTPSEPADQNETTVHQLAAPNDTLQASNMQAAVQNPSMQVDAVQGSQQQLETDDLVQDDFVMVDKKDGSAPQDNEPAHPAISLDYPEPLDQDITGDDLQDFSGDQEPSFEANDLLGDSIDFGDMDTAGDELSGYAQEIANMGAGASDPDDLGLDSPPSASPLPVTEAPSAEQRDHPAP